MNQVVFLAIVAPGLAVGIVVADAAYKWLRRVAGDRPGERVQ